LVDHWLNDPTPRVDKPTDKHKITTFLYIRDFRICTAMF